MSLENLQNLSPRGKHNCEWFPHCVAPALEAELQAALARLMRRHPPPTPEDNSDNDSPCHTLNYGHTGIIPRVRQQPQKQKTWSTDGKRTRTSLNQSSTEPNTHQAMQNMQTDNTNRTKR